MGTGDFSRDAFAEYPQLDDRAAGGFQEDRSGNGDAGWYSRFDMAC
jgi:hypothetical protein